MWKSFRSPGGLLKVLSARKQRVLVGPKGCTRRSLSQSADTSDKDAANVTITPSAGQRFIIASRLADAHRVFRPWGMAVWDELKDGLNKRIKAAGAQNAYFPLLLPISNLSKEASHIEGFAKECAVVTHHRLIKDPSGSGLIPDPEAKLDEPLVIRPTSETIIWDMYRRWVRSYRDLPILINQWANVLRWEMRTRPFLRSAEFLWQEGHTAHETKDGALSYATKMLGVYADAARQLLAIPVIKGAKSPSERFGGAEDTLTIEALMQNGWALQAGTSHFLGQNFARAFDVKFSTRDQGEDLVWATSWGVSTRLMGALIMVHGDDKGVVLPPAVAPVQAVVIPLGRGKGTDAQVDAYIQQVVSSMEQAGVRCQIDSSAEGFGIVMVQQLKGLQNALYEQARARLTEGTHRVSTYAEMKDAFDKGMGGMFLVPWTEDSQAEAEVQQECKATIRCYPYEHNGPGAVAGLKCFRSGRDATHMALFARAF